MSSSYLTPYLPLVATFALMGAMGIVLLLLTALLGPRSSNPVKDAPFECGSEPIGSARQRFAVKFYVVALLFIIFDLEIAFLFPWAVLFKELAWVGFVEMLLFAGWLVVGLIYIWRRGALEWD